MLSTMQHAPGGFKTLVRALAGPHNEATGASSVWYFHLTAKPRFGPLKGRIHTFEPLALSGGSGFSLKAFCICFPFKCHKCEVHICAKVTTDRWCRNDFQKLGQAGVQEVACLDSLHSGLTVANAASLLRMLFFSPSP